MSHNLTLQASCLLVQTSNCLDQWYTNRFALRISCFFQLDVLVDNNYPWKIMKVSQHCKLILTKSDLDLLTNSKALVITAPYVQGLSIKPLSGALVLVVVLRKSGMSKSRAEIHRSTILQMLHK